MDHTAFDNLLSILDDALALAKEATDLSEVAHRQPASAPEPITLTKVARAKAESVARVVHGTGAFRGQTVADIANTLETAGPAGHLEILEKLASMAVFPLHLDDELGGNLVEKSAADRAYPNLPPKTALWRKAMDEAEEELD
jgi:hypothetical protein